MLADRSPLRSARHAFGGEPYIKYNSDGDSLHCYFGEVILLKKGDSRGSLDQEEPEMPKLPV
jgi:hypothetical protein